VGTVKNLIFFSAVIFFKFLVIKALDPDWIRIRIGIQPQTLDPDPDQMNEDPKPWLKVISTFCYVLVDILSTVYYYYLICEDH
jgi:hypothetical protein